MAIRALYRGWNGSSEGTKLLLSGMKIVIDYVELIEQGKSSRKLLNRNEGEKRGKDRNEGKTSERKLSIACVSPIRVLPGVYSLGISPTERGYFQRRTLQKTSDTL